jgi:hypothetical protein
MSRRLFLLLSSVVAIATMRPAARSDTAEGKTSLDGIEIDAGLKATLERLMPIYHSA